MINFLVELLASEWWNITQKLLNRPSQEVKRLTSTEMDSCLPRTSADSQLLQLRMKAKKISYNNEASSTHTRQAGGQGGGSTIAGNELCMSDFAYISLSNCSSSCSKLSRRLEELGTGRHIGQQWNEKPHNLLANKLNLSQAGRDEGWLEATMAFEPGASSDKCLGFAHSSGPWFRL